MSNFFPVTLDFVSQFTGGRGGIDHVVNYGIGTIFFGILLVVAIFQRCFSNEARERLLVWGFGVALVRELFMVSMSYIQALGLVHPDSLHVVFPPLEHALSNIATITIAAAFLRYLLNDIPRSKIYLKAGIASVILCYFATFGWWAQHILADPSSKFGQTWCDWLFRINASIWLLIPIIWLVLKTKGWLCNTVCLAFTLFFLSDFLKIADMALGEVYENIFTPFRHGFYLLAIPLFGYVYIREMCEQRIKVREEKLGLEHQLSQSQKMEAIGTLAGGIAHDFNNILTPIIGYLELARLQAGEDRDPALSKNLKQVRKAAERAREMVSQILTFSRRDSENKSAIQVHIIIMEALKLLRVSLPATIEIKQNIDTQCGSVLGNSTQVHQVLMNLCTNAYHAMKETGGLLAVSLTPVDISAKDLIKNVDLKPGRYLLLEVSDSGHGIDPLAQGKIFDPYFTTKDKGEGTGMGLSVVHGVVESIGGQVRVCSEVGRGTTFYVYLPVSAEKLSQEEVLSGSPSPRGTEKIILVDDEEPVGDIERDMLMTLGYDVQVFADPLEALEQYRAQPDVFDLIITDMTMPKMTGDKLAQEIMAIRPDMPVILCTGYSDLIDEESAKSMGIREYITKPVTIQSFGCTVRNVLDGVAA